MKIKIKIISKNKKMNFKKSSGNEGLIKMKANNKLDNLKSDFFLEKIINNFSKKRALKFLKYNKKTQKRIQYNINNYKEYCENYSSIEIEVIPAKGKYGKFIDINKEDRSYYHIYFNNNRKTEVKRTSIKKNKKIKLISIKIDCQVKSFKNLFYNCKCIESINFKQFARNNITDMSYMFYGCSSLKELNLSNFNTNNVTNISFMFYECSSLEGLNLSKFNTCKVKDMSYTFSSCSLLKELNLTNFNTSNVINIADMFYKCSSLKKLNISNFKTDSVTNMREMFRECSLLEELNLQNFNTDHVDNMIGMFAFCEKLKKLNISNFNFTNISNTYNTNGMFYKCELLLDLNISNVNFNDEIYINELFNGCSDILIMSIQTKFKNDEDIEYDFSNYL